MISCSIQRVGDEDRGRHDVYRAVCCDPRRSVPIVAVATRVPFRRQGRVATLDITRRAGGASRTPPTRAPGGGYAGGSGADHAWLYANGRFIGGDYAAPF